MKIGILTYHDTFNAGAFLQTFATYEYLKKTGLDVEVIDYVPKTGFIKEYKTKVITKQPLRGIRAILSQRKFLKNNLKLSSKRVISDSFDTSKKQLAGFDMLVVGSDTVFEVRPREKAFAPEIPNVYYLPADLECKKVSFAASADKSDFNLLNASQSKYLKDSLQNFSHLSVRDKFTQDSISKIASVSSDLVFDPTFLIEFPSTGVKQKLTEIGKFAILNVANKKFGKIVANEYMRRGWKVVCPTKCGLADVNLNGLINPLEWAELYKFAQFTVTDRFHGTIFSLKANCPVLSIDDAIEYVNQTSKKEDMLARLDLISLLVDYKTVNEISQNDVGKLIENTMKDWDYSKIINSLEMAANVSKNYWSKVLYD
ncbi:polysaccharide pyruvyl transferase family protein [Vibrio sp. L5-1]|uniref:polysaccharide pyruvyl transferase family protein n=1 Tax=Vibrio sp. L5-1 TaxID=2912254 RepID=UPI001F18B3AA|nr:polysaccharide pyruvyl transferase family protein [Vibrio sp. L5-1]MCF7497151.1 polysaccharide pyruvyl transferase family protein [Vibrio sp. L5-1]